MFPQLKKLNDESGVVLFIVLMTTIIIMIFSVGILTQSMNENNYSQQQIDQIVSDQLAKGVFWNSYSAGMQNVGATSFVMQGRTYQATLNPNAAGGYSAVVSYDTFQ